MTIIRTMIVAAATAMFLAGAADATLSSPARSACQGTVLVFAYSGAPGENPSYECYRQYYDQSQNLQARIDGHLSVPAEGQNLRRARRSVRVRDSRLQADLL